MSELHEPTPVTEGLLGSTLEHNLSELALEKHHHLAIIVMVTDKDGYCLLRRNVTPAKITLANGGATSVISYSYQTPVNPSETLELSVEKEFRQRFGDFGIVGEPMNLGHYMKKSHKMEPERQHFHFFRYKIEKYSQIPTPAGSEYQWISTLALRSKLAAHGKLFDPLLPIMFKYLRYDLPRAPPRA